MSTDTNTITDEQVAEIADRQIGDSRKVSPLTIWSEVHSGSIVGIAAALQRWREARQPASIPMPARSALPQEHVETLTVAASRLWSSAQDEMEQALGQRLSVVNGHLDTALAERDEALAEYQTARSELDTARERIDALTSALSASEATAASVAEQLATVNTRAEAVETREAQLAQRISESELALSQTMSALEEERTAHRATAANNVVAQSSEIAQLTYERDEARELAVTLEGDCSSKSNEVHRWTQEANDATTRADAATAQANESLTRVSALETELANAHAALATERETDVTQNHEASIQSAELERISRELGEAREHIEAFDHAKAAAAEELARAAQDASTEKQRADAAEQRATQLEARIAEQEQSHAQEVQRHQQAIIEAGESSAADEAGALQRQMATQAKAYEKALQELRANAEQWVAHSRELKQRLGVANERVLFIDARSNAEVSLLRRLSSELERLKPDHELTSRDMQQRMISTTINERLAQKGYQYDSATAVMTKIQR